MRRLMMVASAAISLAACSQPWWQGRSFDLRAGPHKLTIDGLCLRPDLGPPQPYVWTAVTKRFAKLYMWTPWPKLICGSLEDQSVMGRTPGGGANVFFETTYYGEHAREELELTFALNVLQEDLHTRCHPMYHPDGSWWPQNDCKTRRYWPSSSALKVVARSTDMTHFEYANPHYNKRNPSAGAASEDLYLWGSAAAPSALMTCDRPATPEPIEAGAGRVCLGAFSHEGFVTIFSFSQNYVPADQVPHICEAYMQLEGSMEGQASEKPDWRCVKT